MKINPIQQNQTSFGAKLNVHGSVNELPQRVMNRFQKAAQKIGNESDRIDLYIGCQLQKVKFADVNGKLRVKSNPEDICYLRTNTLDAYINGEIQVINFISGCGPTKKYDIKNLSSQVMRYINSLK